MTFVLSNGLRRTLTIDAVVSAASAVLLLFAGDELARWLAVPETLLRYAGGLLVPFALYVGTLARREAVTRSGVAAVIGMNIAWVVASVWLVIGSSVRPSPAGYVFIGCQALAVALLAELQYMGLRRAAPRSVPA